LLPQGSPHTRSIFNHVLVVALAELKALPLASSLRKSPADLTHRRFSTVALTLQRELLRQFALRYLKPHWFFPEMPERLACSNLPPPSQGKSKLLQQYESLLQKIQQHLAGHRA
jgi:hypothetical protein